MLQVHDFCTQRRNGVTAAEKAPDNITLALDPLLLDGMARGQDGAQVRKCRTTAVEEFDINAKVVY